MIDHQKQISDEIVAMIGSCTAIRDTCSRAADLPEYEWSRARKIHGYMGRMKTALISINELVDDLRKEEECSGL